MSKNVSPNNGGCWYCHTQDEDMEFSCEFDAYLHLECLKEVVREELERDGKLHAETRIIAREFNLEVPS